VGESGDGQPIRLTTERLILRDFVAADEPDVHAYRSDPEVARFMLSHQPARPEQTRAWLQQAIEERRCPRTHYTLAIVLRADDRVVGQISIGPGEDYPAPGELGVGYMLARPAWGGGYATEAARAIVDFGFRALGARQVSAWCSAANPASARVLEKSGMGLELREEGTWPKTGEPTVSLRYTLLREAWAEEHEGR
jgi:[ribosomal protein S5]-alanine N-acetyltransferase